jgi:hypothetical protein
VYNLKKHKFEVCNSKEIIPEVGLARIDGYIFAKDETQAKKEFDESNVVIKFEQVILEELESLFIKL